MDLLQRKLDEEKPLTDIAGLVRQLKWAWAGISPSALVILVLVCQTECAAVSLSRVTTWVNKNKQRFCFPIVLDGVKGSSGNSGTPCKEYDQ